MCGKEEAHMPNWARIEFVDRDSLEVQVVAILPDPNQNAAAG